MVKRRDKEVKEKSACLRPLLSALTLVNSFMLITLFFTFTFHLHALEKEMATHSRVLAWRIPGMGEPWAAIYGVTQSQTRLK